MSILALKALIAITLSLFFVVFVLCRLYYFFLLELFCLHWGVFSAVNYASFWVFYNNFLPSINAFLDGVCKLTVHTLKGG